MIPCDLNTYRTAFHNFTIQSATTAQASSFFFIFIFRFFPRAFSQFYRVHGGVRMFKATLDLTFYLFQLLLYLHRPLDYSTTNRVLDPLHIRVHVVQCQHLPQTWDPVHCLLGHFLCLLSHVRQLIRRCVTLFGQII